MPVLAKIFIRFQIAVYRTIRCEVKHFSCFGKKSAKRSRHRGGADRRSLSELLLRSTILPRLRAALPDVPLPALVERMAAIEIFKIRERRKIRTQVLTSKTITAVSSTGAWWGSGGGRLKDGVEVSVFLCADERLCRSAPPPAAFFGYFLVRTQESNTYPLLEQYDKHQFTVSAPPRRR